MAPWQEPDLTLGVVVPAMEFCEERDNPQKGLRGVMPAWPFCLWKLQSEDADMGELLDALNQLDAGGAAPNEPKSTVDQAAKAFQSASRRVGAAVDAAPHRDMPLDVLTKLVRQAPLQSLAIAFVFGVMVAKR